MPARSKAWATRQPTRETATGGASRVVVEYGWASPRTIRSKLHRSCRQRLDAKKKNKTSLRRVKCFYLTSLFIEPARSSSFFCPIVVGETENRQLSQFL